MTYIIYALIRKRNYVITLSFLSLGAILLKAVSYLPRRLAISVWGHWGITL